MNVIHDTQKARIGFKRVFSAAHRLWNDDSKCRHIHGHNFTVWVTIDIPRDQLNEQGFAIPFDKVKKIIDAMDHTLILDREDPMIVSNLTQVFYTAFVPSTENLSKGIADAIKHLLPSTAIVFVRLRETEGIEAEAWA